MLSVDSAAARALRRAARRARRFAGVSARTAKAEGMRPSRQKTKNWQSSNFSEVPTRAETFEKKPMHARVCARLAVSENLRGGLAQAPRDKSDVREARADVGGRFHPLRRAATPLPVHPPIICAPRHLHRRRARIFRPAESAAADSENKSAAAGRGALCINTINWRGRRRRRRHRDAILWLEMARARLREVGMDRLLRRSLYRRRWDAAGLSRRSATLLAPSAGAALAATAGERLGSTVGRVLFPALTGVGLLSAIVAKYNGDWRGERAAHALQACALALLPALQLACLPVYTLSMQGAVGCAWLWMAAALPTLDDELRPRRRRRASCSSRSAPRRSCARW